MNKKILVIGWTLVLWVTLALLDTQSFSNLGSLVLRQRTVRPPSDLSYVTCKKYESPVEDGLDFKVYLASSKITYAVTTDTGRTIDVSSIVNADYFRQQKIGLGQSEPSLMKYEISYSRSAITLLSKIFINGTEFKCPDIVLPILEDPTAATLAEIPSCNEIVYDLSEEEKQGVTCTWDYAFSIEKTIPSTQIVSRWDSSISLLVQLLVPSVYAYTLSPTTTYFEPTTSQAEPYTTYFEPTTTQLEPTTTNIEPTTEYYLPTTTQTEPSTTYSEITTTPPMTTRPVQKRRCENGVNINDYMNCKCPYGTYEYIKDDYTVVACRVKVWWEKPKKETLRKVIKNGLGFWGVELPADKDGQGWERGWGITWEWHF